MKIVDNNAWLLVGMLSAALLGAPAYGDDVFTVTATPTGEGSQVTAGDSDLLNLVQQTIEGTGPFTELSNYETVSVLDYGGAENAMQFHINAAGTQAVLTIPSISVTRTFTAANRTGLYNQIKNYLQNQGRGDYKRFLDEMNRRSTVAVMDGNPNSTTAAVAKASFEEAGLGGVDTTSRALQVENVNLSLLMSAGQFNTNGLSGRAYSLPLGYSFKITDRVRTKVRAPLMYWEVEDAQIFSGSLIVNVPVEVLVPTVDPDEDVATQKWLSRLTWTVTPTVGIAGGGSRDYRAGSVMYVGGLASMLGYDFGRWGLTIGNQWSLMRGLSSHVGDYDVGGDVDQRILKNGFKVTLPFNTRWVAEAYGVHTAFLRDAAVNSYFTVGAQGGVRLYGSARGASGVFLLGAYSDFGDDYRSFNVRLGSGFRF